MNVEKLRLAMFLAPVVVLIAAFPLLPRLAKRWQAQRYPSSATAGRFVLQSTVEGQDLREPAETLEAFYQAFQAAVGESLGLSEVRGPVTVICFPDKASLSWYVEKKFLHTFDYNAGYYEHESRTIALYRTDPEGLFHEAVHMALHLGNPHWEAAISPWVNEGLAQLFEGARVQDGRLNVDGPSANALAAQVLLLSGEFPSLEQLLGSTNKAYESKDNDKVYLGSFALADYLWHRHQEAFLGYVARELKSGQIRSELLYSALRMSPAELETSLTAWVQERE